MGFEILEKALGRKFTASELLHRQLIQLPGGRATRIVYGPLASALHIDYANLSLGDVRALLESALLSIGRGFPEIFEGKKIRVYEGGNHLDIINDGVGSMGWLIVEDHVR